MNILTAEQAATLYRHNEPHFVLCGSRQVVYGADEKASMEAKAPNINGYPYKWKVRKPGLAEIAGHIAQGNMVGIAPYSLGCFVLDLDEGMPEPILGKLLEMGIAYTAVPSRKGWHIWIRVSDNLDASDKPVQWTWAYRNASGDGRCNGGYVLLHNDGIVTADWMEGRLASIKELKDTFANHKGLKLTQALKSPGQQIVDKAFAQHPGRHTGLWQAVAELTAKELPIQPAIDRAIELGLTQDAEFAHQVAQGRLKGQEWYQGSQTASKTHTGLPVASDGIPAPEDDKWEWYIGDIMELEDDEPLLTIDGEAIFPESGVVLLAGASASGKSQWMFWQALELAKRGYDIRYVVGESFGGGLKRRLQALLSHYFDGDTSWYQNIRFIKFQALPGKLKQYPEDYWDKLGRGKADVVIIDTHRAISGIDDENSSAEISDSVMRIRQLGKLAVIVHHSNKGKEQFSGSYSFESDVDALIFTAKECDDITSLKCVKMKEHFPFAKKYYTAELVESSFVPVQVDADEAHSIIQSSKGQKVTFAPTFEQRILSVLEGLDKPVDKWFILDMLNMDGKPITEKTLRNQLGKMTSLGQIKGEGENGKTKLYSLI